MLTGGRGAVASIYVFDKSLTSIDRERVTCHVHLFFKPSF